MRKILLIFIHILLISNLCGCFGKKDLNQLVIVTAIALDKSDEGFKLSAQVMNPYATGTDARDVAAIIVVSEEGKTVLEALRKMTDTFPSRLFISQFQLLIFGEELAKEGIEKYLNFFFMDHESQHKYYIMVTKGVTGEETLKVQTMMNLINAESIEGKVEASYESYGTSIETPIIDDVINTLRTNGNGLTLPAITIEGDPKKGEEKENTQTSTPDTIVTSSNVGVFKRDKLIGWLNEKETQGYNHIIGKIKSSVIPITMSDGSVISLEVYKTKSDIKLKVMDNQPSIIVNHTIVGGVSEDMSGMTKYNKEYVKEIKQLAQKEVLLKMNAALDKAQKKYNSDIFHFASLIHRKEPKLWNSIKQDYTEIFPYMEVQLNVKIDINRIRR